jgi:hypothetical protein
VRVKVVTLTYSCFSGALDFNGAVSVTGVTGTYNSVPIFSCYQSFSFLGRLANFTVAFPYGVGAFQGSVAGVERQIYRSDPLDTAFRLSVNFVGDRVMRPVQEFVRWRQKHLLSVGERGVARTGQYDSARLVDWSIDRCAAKAGRWIFAPVRKLCARRIATYSNSEHMRPIARGQPVRCVVAVWQAARFRY